MESQHQNPEFRNNPETFYPCCITEQFQSCMNAMESQHQNPEFRKNPENFHTCCITEQFQSCTNAQASNALTTKSSEEVNSSLLKVSHLWVRPWYRSPSNHRPNTPLK